MQSGQPDHGYGTQLAEPEVAVRRAPLHRVIMLNDDYTAMEFVIAVLRRVFEMDLEQAQRVMLLVHTAGQAVCGVYRRQIAEARCAEVHRLAEENDYPLRCEVEPVEEDDHADG